METAAVIMAAPAEVVVATGWMEAAAVDAPGSSLTSVPHQHAAAVRHRVHAGPVHRQSGRGASIVGAGAAASTVRAGSSIVMASAVPSTVSVGTAALTVREGTSTFMAGTVVTLTSVIVRLGESDGIGSCEPLRCDWPMARGSPH